MVNAPMMPIALVAALLLAIPAIAEAACPPGLPPGIFCGEPSLAAATAGTYAIDPTHAAVVARVSHIGYSWSVFRFGAVAGTLAWDPAALGQSKLSVSVDTGSIATPVAGFPAELTGDKFLKATAFPQARFVSTAFRQTDATHGQVDGDFTLMGVTRPLTFNVALIGAGKGFGQPRIGVEATARLDPTGFGLPPMFAAPIELIIDAEFVRKP